MAVLLAANGIPLSFYDYHRPLNGFSPEVTATGGLNVTNPQSSHTAFYNPALLAFRDKTVIAVTARYFSEQKTGYDEKELPEANSIEWYRSDFSYFGFDGEGVGFSYAALADLSLERMVSGEETTERHYADYYLDAYRISFAERSGMLGIGFNLSLLTGRVVYYRESIQDDLHFAGQFTDKRGWGYNMDFGAVVKSGGLSYGLTVPNLLSKLYWQGERNETLQRRIHTGIQWGNENNYVVSGYSRKFSLSSKSTYHLGMQQIMDFGMIRGQRHYLPLRVGINTESFRKLKEIGYSIGSGYRFSVFQIDAAFMTDHGDRERFTVQVSLSVGL